MRSLPAHEQQSIRASGRAGCEETIRTSGLDEFRNHDDMAALRLLADTRGCTENGDDDESVRRRRIMTWRRIRRHGTAAQRSAPLIKQLRVLRLNVTRYFVADFRRQIRVLFGNAAPAMTMARRQWKRALPPSPDSAGRAHSHCVIVTRTKPTNTISSGIKRSVIQLLRELQQADANGYAVTKAPKPLGMRFQQ